MIAALVLASWPQTASGEYLHQYSYVSPEFFSAWTFRYEDPTHGTVNYVGQAEAEAAGLVSATADRVIMGVDTQAMLQAGGGGRRSVRVESRSTYSEGLFVLRLDHVPSGCGLWPAFWMFGQDRDHPWPTWGEFDIIEGVHTATRVMTTLHTSQHCSQAGVGTDSGGPSVEWDTGQQGGPADNCHIAASDQWSNQGCSQRGPEATFGAPFNAAGGGTFAAEWDPQAGYIRTWFWPVGSEPADLARQAPEPAFWSEPYSYFRLDPQTCSPEHFQNMRLVFDITFCGDLGDPTFADSCPEEAAKGLSCPEFVRMHPEVMKEAYWSIRALDVYIRGSPTVLPPPREPNPSNWWWNWLVTFAGLAALAAVALLYTVVWAKVQRDSGHSNCLTALFEHFEQSQAGLQKSPLQWLNPAKAGSWAQVSLYDVEEAGHADANAAAGQPHLANGIGGARARPGVPAAVHGGTPPVTHQVSSGGSPASHLG